MYSDLLIGDLSDKRFYGVYRGVVANNEDPDNLGRLKLRVPQLLGVAITNWAWPVLPIGVSILNVGTPGTTAGVTDATVSVEPIAPGSGVWVMFEGGDPNFPLWIGRF